MAVPASSQELALALVSESAKKSRVCWVSWSGHQEDGAPAGRAPRLVWHAWYDGALLVLSGDDQVLDGIESATTVEVVMRSKDTGGELVRWTGAVHVVDPSSDSWDEHATALLGVRLNLPDPGAARETWRAAATVLRIVPTGATGATGGQPTGPLP